MAQLTLTVDDAHVPRILAAVATDTNPNPTVADVKQRLIDYLQAVVQRYEREQAATATLTVS
jgi:hypothetical protein